tara:strand:+ start:291 stop:905 length:615 start_codon:yes stop_codon:yes gene_type:complete
MIITTEGLEDTIITPFAPLVYFTRVPNNIIAMLAAAGETARAESTAINDQLVGEIKHEYALVFSDADSSEWVDFVWEKTIEFYNKTPITPNHTNLLKNASLGQPWINYSYAGNFNPMHIHTGSLSYIIYVDIPDNIRDNYKNGYSQTKGILELSYNNSQVHVSPRTGDMIIFPSNVYHGVYPFDVDGCRISVSGNIHDAHVENI